MEHVRIDGLKRDDVCSACLYRIGRKTGSRAVLLSAMERIQKGILEGQKPDYKKDLYVERAREVQSTRIYHHEGGTRV